MTGSGEFWVANRGRRTRVRVAPGPVDVHAHFLPRSCYDLPPGSVTSTGESVQRLEIREGMIYWGEHPFRVGAAEMSDVEPLLEDMDRARLAVRVLSAPPTAFPVADAAGVDTYSRRFNEELVEVCGPTDGRLVGLGIVPVASADAAEEEMRWIADNGELAGIAIPPFAGGDTLDVEPLRSILLTAAQLDLCVLVHPSNTARPGMQRHYMPNLLGNPFESAAAIGGVIFGGVLAEAPNLRICFLHGAGCAPSVLGRWDHGWQERAESRNHTTEPPSNGFRRLYCDTLTHGLPQLALLQDVAGEDRIVLGTDYPFDMGELDPVGFAERAGLAPEVLAENARRFVGVETSSSDAQGAPSAAAAQ